MGVQYPYIDLHCDTLNYAWQHHAEDIWHLEGSMTDVVRNRAGGCTHQLYAVFMPCDADIERYTRDYPGDEAYIAALHGIWQRTLNAHGDVIAQALCMSDAEENAKNGRISGMLSMEDGRAVQGSFENIRRFYNMGFRMMNLTWNFSNCFGAPNSEDPAVMAQGLTDFGKEAIGYMNDLGMIVDVSHLSDGGFRDVAQLSRKPFIASHSNCRALNPHPRSMTDDMIRVLADKGGIMGVNFYPPFLSEDVRKNDMTIDDVSRQLRHRINTGGLECAAVGTDFDGISGELEVPASDRRPWFFDELKKRGFPSDELDHICRKNTERFFRETLG